MISPSVNDHSSNIDQARRAFSAQAPHFDSYERENVIVQWMRQQVYKHEQEFLAPGDSILELNAGTGIDAIHYAQLGHSIFAIDNADGMLGELEKKVKASHLEDKIGYALCSYTELRTLPPRRFDHVLSNFGGLNCVADLGPVAEQLPHFLKPGGTITFVIMPPVCPWELLHLAKGNVRMAFRRFSKNGATAHIEGFQFLAYYFSPRQIVACFDKRFTLAKLRGLASLSPPPFMFTLAEKYPRLYKVLRELDEQVSTLPPFNRWADHYIITLRYSP